MPDGDSSFLLVFFPLFFPLFFLTGKKHLLGRLGPILPTSPDYGPTQVKSRLLSSSIFDAMNFQHFFEMLEIMLQHF